MEGLAVTIVTAFAGAALGFLFQEWRHRRDLAAKRRDERIAAARSYLIETHETAHSLGRAAARREQLNLGDVPGAVPFESEAERAQAFERVSGRVSRDLAALEIVATIEAIERARDLHETLRTLRDHVRDGVVYNSEQYRADLEEYRDARHAYIDAVRSELWSDQSSLPRRQPRAVPRPHLPIDR